MSGGIVCSVASCKNNSKKINNPENPRWSSKHIIFFTFPKDPKLCKEWIRRCHRKDAFSVKNKRVCSIHFKNDDYEDLMQASTMGFYPKRLQPAGW